MAPMLDPRVALAPGDRRLVALDVDQAATDEGVAVDQGGELVLRTIRPARRRARGRELPAVRWLNRMFSRIATSAAELMPESKIVRNHDGKSS